MAVAEPAGQLSKMCVEAIVEHGHGGIGAGGDMGLGERAEVLGDPREGEAPVV
jgi:hypothetical protein